MEAQPPVHLLSHQVAQHLERTSLAHKLMAEALPDFPLTKQPVIEAQIATLNTAVNLWSQLMGLMSGTQLKGLATAYSMLDDLADALAKADKSLTPAECGCYCKTLESLRHHFTVMSTANENMEPLPLDHRLTYKPWDPNESPARR